MFENSWNPRDRSKFHETESPSKSIEILLRANLKKKKEKRKSGFKRRDTQILSIYLDFSS